MTDPAALACDVYTGGFARGAQRPHSSASAAQIVAAIRDGRHADAVAKVRRAAETHGAGSEEHRRAKEALPKVTWATIGAERHGKAYGRCTGLMCFDIDHYDGDCDALARELSGRPHIVTAFVSPTGDGVKAVLWTDLHPESSAERYTDQYIAVAARLIAKGWAPKLNLDGATKDRSRYCFTSYDPDAEVNAEATPLPLDSVPPPSEAFEAAADAPSAEEAKADAQAAVEAMAAVQASAATAVGPSGWRPAALKTSLALVGLARAGLIDEAEWRDRWMAAAAPRTPSDRDDLLTLWRGAHAQDPKPPKRPKVTLQTAMERAGITLALNDRVSQPLIGERGHRRPLLDDYHLDAIHDDLGRKGYSVSRDRFDRELGAHLHRNRIDPLIEWIEDQGEGDEEEAALADDFMAQCLEGMFAVPEEQRPLAREMVKMILGVAVYRSLHPGYPVKRTPMLHSLKTDAGKSTLLAQLAAPCPVQANFGYRFADDPARHIEAVRGMTIVEWQELAGLKRHNTDDAAAMLSTPTQAGVRLAFGRQPYAHEARHSMVITTNKTAEIPWDRPAFTARIAVLALERSEDAPPAGTAHQRWLEDWIPARLATACWKEVLRSVRAGWVPEWSPAAESVIAGSAANVVTDPDEGLRESLLERLRVLPDVGGGPGKLPAQLTVSGMRKALQGTPYKHTADSKLGHVIRHPDSPYGYGGRITRGGTKVTVYDLKDRIEDGPHSEEGGDSRD